MAEAVGAARVKEEVARRAHDCCEYCRGQARFALESLSVEHIIPKSRGGKTALENLALACQGCNNHKYNKTSHCDPVTNEMTPLFHPRTQRWSDHFAWTDDFALVIGLTSVGRATVEALRLNRPEVVNLRRVLFQAGEHPPPQAGAASSPAAR